MKLRLYAVVLTVCLSAAAHGQEAPTPPHRHGGHGGGGLFVSPCGRPYRAGPGEPYPVAAWFVEADTDHDGSLDRAEFRADARAFFAILDRNHDGVIDSSEVTYYEQNIVPEILRGRPSPQAAVEARIILAQFGGGGGGGRGGGHHGSGSKSPPATPQAPGTEMVGAAPYNLLAEPEPVTAADTAFNEQITQAEFVAAADRHFDALDVKGAGRIALADLPKTAVQSRPHGPPPGQERS